MSNIGICFRNSLFSVLSSNRSFQNDRNRSISRFNRFFRRQKPRKRHPLRCVNDVNWDAFSQPLFHQPHPPRPIVRQYDFAVVGSGIAGLTYALKVAKYGNVAILTKKKANDGCTQYAQGGVCAVLDASDSVEDHVHDTLVAGVYLNDRRYFFRSAFRTDDLLQLCRSRLSRRTISRHGTRPSRCRIQSQF